MISVTDQFLAALRAPHLLATQATLYPATGAPLDLPVMDGQVTIDRTAAQRRSLDLTLPTSFPPDHPLAGQDIFPSLPGDLVNVYGAEVSVWRGIEFASTSEMAQLGVFRVDELDRDLPAGTVTLTGFDRSIQISEERFLKPRKFAAMRALDLIQLLITEVYPAAIFDLLTTDHTMIKKHVVDRDRWAEVQRVGRVIGCEVFATETGAWRVQPVPDPTTASPVWAVDAGPTGVLVGVRDTVVRTGAPNGVVAIGQTFSGDTGTVTISNASPGVVTQTGHGLVFGQQVTFSTTGTLPNPLTAGNRYYVHSVIDKDHFTVSPSYGGAVVNTTTNGSGTHRMSVTGYPVYGIAHDDNPLSPTYWKGPYGQIVKFYSSPHLKTQAQVDRVAQAQLADHLGVSKTIDFQSIPNPALEAGDTVTVLRPDGTSENHLADVLTIPLGPAGTMEGQTRAADWLNAQ